MNTRLILAGLTAAALAACGGGSDSTPAAPNPPPSSTPAATGNVKVTLTFPVAASVASGAIAPVVHQQTAAQASAQPQSYISSKTQSVSIKLLTVNGAEPATPVGVTVDVKAGSDCVVSGSNLNCTVSLAAPVGNDQFEVNTWPGTGATGNMALSTGTGTVAIAANTNADLAVELLPRVNEFSVDITPANGTQPIDSAGTFTAHIRGNDSAGDLITGTTAYHDPIVITNKDIVGAHITASPSLPATFTSPARDTLTFTYDGAGTAASYAFMVTSGISQMVYVTLASNQEHIYVSLPDTNRIDVYDIHEDGSLTGPSRSIVGPHTGLNKPTSVAVDSLSQIYVVNTDKLTIFAAGASDDATPIHNDFVNAYPYYVSDKAGMVMTRSPKDPNTGYTTYTVYPNYAQGVQIVGEPNLGPIPPFVVQTSSAVASFALPNGVGYLCSTYVDSTDPNQNRVECFKQPVTWATGLAGVASDYPNIQIFNGAANNTITAAFVNASDLKFQSNGALIVSSYAKYHTEAALETYSVGTGQRLTSIHGDSSRITAPGAIAVDSKGNLYVLDHGLSSGAGAVLQFPATADSDVRPRHTLSGFNNPGGMAIGK